MTTPTLLPLTAADLPPLLPELVVIGGAFALLILDLFISQRHKVWTHFLSVAILVVAFALLIKALPHSIEATLGARHEGDYRHHPPQ